MNYNSYTLIPRYTPPDFRYPRVCVMNSVCNNEEPLLTLSYTAGELFSLDNQCQLLRGSFSKICVRTYTSDNINI